MVFKGGRQMSQCNPNGPVEGNLKCLRLSRIGKYLTHIAAYGRSEGGHFPRP